MTPTRFTAMWWLRMIGCMLVGALVVQVYEIFTHQWQLTALVLPAMLMILAGGILIGAGARE